MRKIIIMGAGGRDFHNFNVAFRNDPSTEVVAFTATQIPGIAGRVYPPALAGPHYPQGIPIRPEEELTQLVNEHHVDEVILSYSDLSHETVMHKASIVLAAGADFRLMGPHATMLRSTKPVVAVCATRTGCGKSQTSRKVGKTLLDGGLKVASSGIRCRTAISRRCAYSASPRSRRSTRRIRRSRSARNTRSRFAWA